MSKIRSYDKNSHRPLTAFHDIRTAIVPRFLLILAAVLLLSGCSSNQNNTTNTDSSVTKGSYDEHLNISIAFWNVEDALESQDAVLEYIEEKFNVTFVAQNITWNDYNEKVKLWAETRSLPDLFVGDYRNDNIFYEWVEDGLLHEIPSDLSDYSNLEAYLDEETLETCMVNGKIYCIFRQTYSEQAETTKDRTILYRWDLAQEAGITKEPETWDEFREMIQAIISQDPEGKGISGMTAKTCGMLIGPLLTYSIPLASAGGTASFYWVAGEDGYVPAVFAGDTLGSDALPTWNLIRQMYAEGTIEEDILIATSTEAEDDFLNGKNAAICVDGGIAQSYETIIQYWEEINGNDFFDDVKYLNLMPSVDGELYYTAWGYAWSESYINADVSDEKLNRILAIYDYLLSDEGITLTHYGLEGETYEKEEDGSLTFLTDEQLSDIYPSISVFYNLVSWTYDGYEDTTLRSVPQSCIDADEERVETARACTVPEDSYECRKAFLQLGSSFTIDIDDIFMRIMTGSEPVEELWAQIIDEYKDKGLLEIIEEVNQTVSQ